MEPCTVTTIVGTPPRSNRLCQRCTARKGCVAGEDPLGTGSHPRTSCLLCLGTRCTRARRRRTSCQSGSCSVSSHPRASRAKGSNHQKQITASHATADVSGAGHFGQVGTGPLGGRSVPVPLLKRVQPACVKLLNMVALMLTRLLPPFLALGLWTSRRSCCLACHRSMKAACRARCCSSDFRSRPMAILALTGVGGAGRCRIYHI